MISRIDTLSDITINKKLRYVEFLVLVGRISHEIYKQAFGKEYPLHFEINEILPVLLRTEGLKMIFEFSREAYDYP